MITRVLNERGEVLHDCTDANCDVSWDGYVIADGTASEGRKDPNPAVWRQIDKHTVQQLPQT